MNQSAAKKDLSQILQLANIHINGNEPWDIQVYNEDFYNRVLNEGSLGLGESYMDNWWDCKRLDQFFERATSADLENKIKQDKWLLFKLMTNRFLNMQNKKRSLKVGKMHYDLGQQLFQAMLDNRMNYTCGYWENTDNLDQAQLNKLELVCQKLLLKPGMKMLDIGCGYGALAKYAAENYGVQVVGVTISKDQYEYALTNCAGLPVEIRFQDYRDVDECFDRIVSLGMFEHVSYLNYRTYMQVVKRCLNNDGLFLLHTIGSNVSTVSCDKWIAKYIFPNGMLPSIAQIGKASEGLLVMEDWHNFGDYYDKTLMAWHANLESHWKNLKMHYDDRFKRMWDYYLLSCAGSFRARQVQLWQIVFSSSGLIGGYHVRRPHFS